MSAGFTFKQFHINHGGCGMPVSTDGILLGAWAKLDDCGAIVDIGTGSGLLAVMAAQRTHNSTITAIELESTAVKVARHNFAQSPWAHRLHCIEHDILSWYPTQPEHSIDSIVCNPPYFNFGQQANAASRAQARHTETLSHDALLNALSYLLTEQGQASLILPAHEGQLFIAAAKTYGLHCQRVCQVQSTAKKPVLRLLIGLTRDAQCETEETTLCIHDGNGYSSAFISLTHPFYLNM